MRSPSESELHKSLSAPAAQQKTQLWVSQLLSELDVNSAAATRALPLNGSRLASAAFTQTDRQNPRPRPLVVLVTPTPEGKSLIRALKTAPPIVRLRQLQSKMSDCKSAGLRLQWFDHPRGSARLGEAKL
jgi:hypothetical protein